MMSGNDARSSGASAAWHQHIASAVRSGGIRWTSSDTVVAFEILGKFTSRFVQTLVRVL